MPTLLRKPQREGEKGLPFPPSRGYSKGKMKKPKIGPSVERIHPYGTDERQELPFFDAPIPAGFPSPAEGYLDKKLDLNELLIRHPAATFFVRVAGESMIQAGIHSGDILVVDRAQEPRSESVVVAVIDGELTVKRIRKRGDRIFLLPENPDFPVMEILGEMNFEVWGVVTYVIHSL